MKKCLGLLVLAACSSSSGSSLSGNGSFTVNSQFGGVLDGGLAATAGIVVLGNFDPPRTCGDLTDGGIKPVGKEVSIAIFPADGGAVDQGSYDFTGPFGATPTGSYAKLGLFLLADGGGTLIAYATSGTLNLTGVGSTWDGDFTAEMNSGGGDGGFFGVLTGTFSAPACSL